MWKGVLVSDRIHCVLSLKLPWEEAGWSLSEQRSVPHICLSLRGEAAVSKTEDIESDGVGRQGLAGPGSPISLWQGP